MYSAFSERSPCAAASATACVTFGRSMRQSCSSSSRRRRSPSGVMYFEAAGAGARNRPMTAILSKPRCSVEPITDAGEPRNYAVNRGYEVLHAFHDGGSAGTGHGLLERVERGSGAAASAGGRRRYARAAMSARAELRSGFGRDQDYALGASALRV